MGYICMTTAVQVRAALITSVTRKAIFMNKVTVETAGDIVNFVASDITKVFDGMLVRLQAKHHMQLFHGVEKLILNMC